MPSHGIISAVKRSRDRANRLILEMFADMVALARYQKSIPAILRYMLACFHYKIDTVIVGSHPYPDKLVPLIGSSYSQTEGTNNAPSTRIMGEHFSSYDDLVKRDMISCIRSSWKTIEAGCIWLNASYDNKSIEDTSDIMSLKRLHYSIEFICAL
jgi:hypothetical protein